jgi:hypothetical protein
MSEHEKMAKQWLRDKENELRQQASRVALAFTQPKPSAACKRVAAAYRAAADAILDHLTDWEDDADR